MQTYSEHLREIKGGIMVYRNKGHFTLDVECLQKVVDYILKRPQNKDIRIEIEKSPNEYSKSLYLRFYIGDDTTALRISDHECKGDIRQIIVGESTGIANVCYKIESAINALRFKRLRGLLDRGL